MGQINAIVSANCLQYTTGDPVFPELRITPDVYGRTNSEALTIIIRPPTFIYR